MDMDIEMPFEPSSFIQKKSLDAVFGKIKGKDPSDKVDDEVSSEKSNDDVPFEEAGDEVDKYDDETDIEDDDDIDAEVPASKVDDESLDRKSNDGVPAETGTSDVTDENYADKDVVMKEKSMTPVDKILKCDTASNSDSVLAPEKRSILSPQKLDFKPLASLLLEAIQTPKRIEDPLTESM